MQILAQINLAGGSPKYAKYNTLVTFLTVVGQTTALMHTLNASNNMFLRKVPLGVRMMGDATLGKYVPQNSLK